MGGINMRKNRRFNFKLLILAICFALLMQITPAVMADPYPDTNEPAIPDRKDFRTLDAYSDGTSLAAIVVFFGVPKVKEFLLYVDTGGFRFLTKCHPNNFEVYKPGKTGDFTEKIFTGKPVAGEKTYQITIPQKDVFGKANPLRVWIEEKSAGDRLPNQGYLEVMKI